jgi:predicted heme/steroid binding protein
MQLIKINRAAAWILLVTIFLFFISGYGMTKGIIDRQLSIKLHQDILPLLVITAFIVHASISIKFAFMRWRIWNNLTKIGLIIVSLFAYLLFLYAGLFYQPGIPKAVNTNNFEPNNDQQAQKTFTVSELSEYNGKDGNPAYVAVDGIIYDLTNVFIDGEHFGHFAGQDLTSDFFTKHMKSQITKYPTVGLLK